MPVFYSTLPPCGHTLPLAVIGRGHWAGFQCRRKRGTKVHFTDYTRDNLGGLTTAGMHPICDECARSRRRSKPKPVASSAFCPACKVNRSTSEGGLCPPCKALGRQAPEPAYASTRKPRLTNQERKTARHRPDDAMVPCDHDLARLREIEVLRHGPRKRSEQRENTIRKRL